MSGEKDIIQKETEPVDELPDGPDGVKKKKEDNAFAGETGRGVFWGEKRSVGYAPEKAKVRVHWVLGSLPSLHGKSPSGLSRGLFYQEMLVAFPRTDRWLFHYNDEKPEFVMPAKSEKYVANFCFSSIGCL